MISLQLPNAAIDQDDDSATTSPGEPSPKKPPPATTNRVFFSEQLNNLVNVSNAKYLKLELFLYYRKRVFLFDMAPDPLTLHKFHQIRIEIMNLVSYYKDWMPFSQAMYHIFRKYGVEKYRVQNDTY